MVNVADARVGFCTVDVNAEGPVQVYVAPAIVLAVKLILFPVQTGLLLPDVGAAGTELIVKFVVTIELAQAPNEAVTE